MWPESILQILHRLENMRGGIIGLIGLQGVGKSSALSALYYSRVQKEGKRQQAEVDRLADQISAVEESIGSIEVVGATKALSGIKKEKSCIGQTKCINAA